MAVACRLFADGVQVQPVRVQCRVEPLPQFLFPAQALFQSEFELPVPGVRVGCGRVGGRLVVGVRGAAVASSGLALGSDGVAEGFAEQGSACLRGLFDCRKLGHFFPFIPCVVLCVRSRRW